MEYLGRIVSREGISADPGKLEAVARLGYPVRCEGSSIFFGVLLLLSGLHLLGLLRCQLLCRSWLLERERDE